MERARVRTERGKGEVDSAASEVATTITSATAPAGGGLSSRLALALDLGSLAEASALARHLAPFFGIAKIGLELFSAAGPLAVEALAAEGFTVFVDLKLHDIPTTVQRAAMVLGSLGVGYATVHTTGGQAMCAAAAEGLASGAAAAGHRPPIGLGVTVLTSDAEASAELLAARAALAAAAGLTGLVCAATDLAVVRGAAPGLVTVVPGTRPPAQARRPGGESPRPPRRSPPAPMCSSSGER